MPTTARRLGLFASLTLLGCAALGKPPPALDEGDDPHRVSGAALSRDGRWVPSEEARRVGEAQSGRYESAPAWRASACSGGMQPGTRALGDYLAEQIDGVTHYDGYACRPNTANRSRMSMHGTGRALDVFVATSGGDADNDVGDPIAHWLIQHATEIGVQLIIWDRTKWNISYAGRKDRAYGGGHPHHDHLHVELTGQGAAGRTPWFAERGAEPSPPPPGGEEVDPACNDTCPYAHDRECDDGSRGGAVYCDPGTDCADCRATPVEGGGLPHAGLALDAMAIPHRGLANATLAGTGMGDTEPYGERVTYEGGEYARGTVSHFGGPDDRWVTSTETGTITGERLRSLNSPLDPSAAVLASRPEDYYFVAMRWRYSPHGRAWLRSARVLMVDPASGRAVVMRPVDWGPHTRTRRIIDVSPQALDDLGVRTDADVLVAWAPRGTPLGPVTRGATPAPAPTPSAPPTELCSDTCRYAGDGECDDGGPGSLYAFCALGSDCADCGPREASAPAPVAPTRALGQSCASASECADALGCRAGFSDRTLHCCVEAAQACSSGADCCGMMDCASGQCACRAAGRACLADGDCCGGRCASGRCE